MALRGAAPVPRLPPTPGPFLPVVSEPPSRGCGGGGRRGHGAGGCQPRAAQPPTNGRPLLFSKRHLKPPGATAYSSRGVTEASAGTLGTSRPSYECPPEMDCAVPQKEARSPSPHRSPLRPRVPCGPGSVFTLAEPPRKPIAGELVGTGFRSPSSCPVSWAVAVVSMGTSHCRHIGIPGSGSASKQPREVRLAAPVCDLG